MTTLYRCDWCDELFDDRSEVALCDFAEKDGSARIHICYGCLPEGVESQLDIQSRAV